jgi:Ubiquitin-activating enzyme active site
VQFHDRIAQLVYTFPEDSVTSTGAPFWSAPKRFPHPLSFDASDASQVLIDVLLVLHQWGTGCMCRECCTSATLSGTHIVARVSTVTDQCVSRFFSVKVAFIQAAAILKARTYRMEIPEWAFAMKQVGLGSATHCLLSPHSTHAGCPLNWLMLTQIASSAAAVELPPFTPQQGVRIETDPKAASVAPGPASGDDESQIAVFAQQLRVRQVACFVGTN